MIRSVLLNAVFFPSMAVFLFFGIFLLPFPEKVVYEYWFVFSRFFKIITKYIGGISFSVENEKNLIQEGVIYAVRHESLWETLAFISFFKKPIFIMKKELSYIPVFGMLSRKVHSIFIDREQGIKTLIEISRKITDALNEGRQVVIFPEGTRMPTGEYVPLKRGIALFYKQNNCKVIPVIHNSGVFWAKHSFKKNPGTIQVKVIDPILPGLTQDEFMNRLNEIFQTEVESMRVQRQKNSQCEN